MNSRPAGGLEIVTPSYAPDFALCRDLVASVHRFAPDGTMHRVIVPSNDIELFSSLASDTVVIEAVKDVLPPGLIKIPLNNVWLSIRSPWPPVRGWIAQQLVKYAAVAASEADSVLIVDSDVEFFRPFDESSYRSGTELVLYRLDDAVDDRLPRHVTWDGVARRLLGVMPAASATLPDYICWPCLWSPRIVRSLLSHVEDVAGMPWAVAIGRELHFSEMVLYGVYVDEVVAKQESVQHTASMHCVNHSDEDPLDAAGMSRFLAAVGRDDVAVMVSAKSGTAAAVRRRALDQLSGIR